MFSKFESEPIPETKHIIEAIFELIKSEKIDDFEICHGNEVLNFKDRMIGRYGNFYVSNSIYGLKTRTLEMINDYKCSNRSNADKNAFLEGFSIFFQKEKPETPFKRIIKTIISNSPFYVRITSKIWIHFLNKKESKKHIAK